jgi:hypothetical protein
MTVRSNCLLGGWHDGSIGRIWAHSENNLPHFNCVASFSDEFKGNIHRNVAVDGLEEELAARVPKDALSGNGRLARVVAVKSKATEPFLSVFDVRRPEARFTNPSVHVAA